MVSANLQASGAKSPSRGPLALNAIGAFLMVSGVGAAILVAQSGDVSGGSGKAFFVALGGVLSTAGAIVFAAGIVVGVLRVT